MSERDYQLDVQRRLAEAEQTATEWPYHAEMPGQGVYVLQQGVAKIVTNDGGGAYTITEQWYRSAVGSVAAAWENATAPEGYVSASARDINGTPTGAQNERVRFWEQRKVGGGLELLIELGPASFWAQISANTYINGSGTAHETDPSTQWTYSFDEVEKTSAGYGGWDVLEGGRMGSDEAYNSLEDMNPEVDPGGVMGNGVVLANLDYDGDDTFEFSLQPAPINAIVRMHAVGFLSGSTQYTEYWFAYENGTDGVCD